MRTLGDGERLVVGVRPHGRVLLGPALILFLLGTTAAGVAAAVPPGPVAGTLRLMVLLVVGAVLVRASVVPFVQWLRTLYAVTDQRVVVRRGVLRRTGRDVPLDRITEIAVRQSRWDRVLGAGRVRVQADGEPVPLILQDVPAVEHVVEAMRKYAGFEPVDADGDVDGDGGAPGADDSWDDEWEVAGVLLDPDAAPDGADGPARGDLPGDEDGALDDLIELPDDDRVDLDAADRADATDDATDGGYDRDDRPGPRRFFGRRRR